MGWFPRSTATLKTAKALGGALRLIEGTNGLHRRRDPRSNGFGILLPSSDSMVIVSSIQRS
jgi:hypothetical protein